MSPTLAPSVIEEVRLTSFKSFRDAVLPFDELTLLVGPMEGLAVRTLDGSEPRIAKVLRPGFAPAGDEVWSARRPRNLLADRELSWR